MERRLIVLALVLFAAVASYAMVSRAGLIGKYSQPVGALAALTQKGGGASGGAAQPPVEYEEVVVMLEIPPMSEFPAPWAKGMGCASTRLSMTLGAAIGKGAGAPVMALEPGKPAAKAGVRVGDLLGGPEDCPNSFYARLEPGPEAETVEWTVRRPKVAAAQDAEASDQRAGQESGPEAQ